MPAETRELKDSVVAVTGASAGIGAATARLLVEAGARVAVQARRKDRLQQLTDELGADNVLAVTGDVRDPQASTDLVSAAVATYGRLDSLVINAGIGMYGGIEDRSDDDLQTMMRTNVEGTIWAARAAVAHFRRAGAGDIVIVASVAGLRGGADEAVYAATKFAQVGFAGALDREVRTDGIRVTAVCPAGVETEFAIGAGRTEGDPALAEYLRPEDVAFAITTVLRPAAPGKDYAMAALEHGAGKLTAGGTDDDPGVQEVIRRELLLLSPEVRASIEQTLTFLHPDFVEFGASGRCWDAAGVAGSMAAGDSESIEAAGFAGVRLADDVVLLTYVSRRPGRTSLRSSVWIRVGTGWLLRFHQGTVVSE